jgi:hypothetical protein
MKDYITTKEDGIIRQLAKELRFANNQEVLLEEGGDTFYKLQPLSESFNESFSRENGDAEIELEHIDDSKNKDSDGDGLSLSDNEMIAKPPVEQPKKKYQRVIATEEEISACVGCLNIKINQSINLVDRYFNIYYFQSNLKSFVGFMKILFYCNCC